MVVKNVYDRFASTSVIVIGAGIAGIAAARSLQLAGVEVLVLEARERLGGGPTSVGTRREFGATGFTVRQVTRSGLWLTSVTCVRWQLTGIDPAV